MWKLTTLFILLAAGVSQYYKHWEPPVPNVPAELWGPKGTRKDDSRIRPFKINVSNQDIQDLKERLKRTRPFVEPLEGAAWTYGVSTKSAQDILHYWREKYDWTERQSLLNKYPQFLTDIQGLTIHFYHVKPTIPKTRKLRVLPLLMVHGWPGSVVEFQKIIPILTTPHPEHDFVFEVIVPSLPGYGFSEGAARPGLATAEIAVIFKNLMSRLGFEKFYTQGGDWGAAITSMMGVLFPERVIGIHLNMCISMSPWNTMWSIVGSYFPSLVVSKEYQSRMYPLTYHWSRMLEETGYMHIQATKPDTIGTALSDSPAALAIYILEKFSTWTNPEYRFREDGGLLEKFTLNELLDNVMIYWVSNSITTSQRLYAEELNSRVFERNKLPVKVPTACANFPHELMYQPESFVRDRYRKLVQFNHMPRGGHFAAMEEPELLANDIREFVIKLEQMQKSEEEESKNQQYDQKEGSKKSQ